ncbi:MAG: recombination protein RecR, partial [Spirochaetae bacterium HGW-Spirochaetae-6]
GEFKGLYHILEGHLSPLDGITPAHLKIKELVNRVSEGKIRELIVATNPNIEGDATAFYLSRLLKEYPVKVTRLAKGLAVGSDLEYADVLSLSNSFRNREQL